MKQMTKEELIEYFIEQLGDNEILGKFMTIEQIREKLNNMIKKVTYNTELGNFAASWHHESDGNGVVNFDISKIQWTDEKSIIVHELLHTLTSSSNKINAIEYKKCGMHLSCVYGLLQDNWNIAINEGMTDTLTEQITGEHHRGYNEEKSFYIILSAIIGEDNMLKTFFSGVEQIDCESISDFARKAKDIFKEDLLKKYGMEFGTEVNCDVKKVLSLTDQLNRFNSKDSIYGLNSEGKRIQNGTKQEIDNTLLKVLKNIIDYEQDVDRKANLFRIIGNYYKKDTYVEALSESFEKNNMNYVQKMEILEKIVELKGHVPFEATRKTLFESPEAVNMDAKLKLEKLFYLNPLDKRNSDQLNTVYELYIKTGKIEGDVFNKKEIFDRCVSNCYTMQDIDTRLMGVKYKKVGDYYLVITEENYGVINREIYKENGKQVNDIDALRRRDINPSELQYIVGEEIDSNTLSNNLKNIMEEYEKSFDESKTRKTGVSFYKDMIMIYNEMDLKSELFYSINQDGTLELIEQRRRKKIYR